MSALSLAGFCGCTWNCLGMILADFIYLPFCEVLVQIWNINVWNSITFYAVFFIFISWIPCFADFGHTTESSNIQMHRGPFKNYPLHRWSATLREMGPYPVQLSRGHRNGELWTWVRGEGRWEAVCVPRVHKDNFYLANTSKKPGKLRSHRMVCVPQWSPGNTMGKTLQERFYRLL